MDSRGKTSSKSFLPHAVEFFTHPPSLWIDIVRPCFSEKNLRRSRWHPLDSQISVINTVFVCSESLRDEEEKRKKHNDSNVKSNVVDCRSSQIEIVQVPSRPSAHRTLSRQANANRGRRTDLQAFFYREMMDAYHCRLLCHCQAWRIVQFYSFSDSLVISNTSSRVQCLPLRELINLTRHHYPSANFTLGLDMYDARQVIDIEREEENENERLNLICQMLIVCWMTASLCIELLMYKRRRMDVCVYSLSKLEFDINRFQSIACRHIFFSKKKSDEPRRQSITVRLDLILIEVGRMPNRSSFKQQQQQQTTSTTGKTIVLMAYRSMRRDFFSITRSIEFTFALIHCLISIIYLWRVACMRSLGLVDVSLLSVRLNDTERVDFLRT